MNAITLDARLGLLGDVHGTPSFIHDSFAWFQKHGVKDVVQMGDFWFYKDRDLVKLERMTRRFGINFHFIDGNHEDFAYLGDSVNTPEPVSLGENVTYLARGTKGTVGDKSFLAMGGAVSVDRMYRAEGKDWFFEENLTDMDALNGTQGDPVDVMFTHDLPMECRSEHTPSRYFGEIVEMDMVQYTVRMNEIYQYHQPDLLVHGHYHKFYDTHVTNYSGKEHMVKGLGADISRMGSAVIMDEDLSLTHVYGTD